MSHTRPKSRYYRRRLFIRLEKLERKRRQGLLGPRLFKGNVVAVTWIAIGFIVALWVLK